ncbi:MAG: GntR family transcriptional regulator [Naasia sp.]|jgi:GntR family transcriptional regulator|uniref:GntR family transcriptional regulator n=1 Tax=Naasia sp. TaxID=2546198 RepID=UPI0026080860|nr:GntR family transcriptional regulator [Naasia sp.]MCU1571562.1 GntR family transcriptional regulator [Naasia sp.]
MSAAVALDPPGPAEPEPIARQAATPMYHQLRHRIIDDIARRGLRPGDLLPSEHQLCERFGVSRTVVRQALLQLEHQGIIDRVKGKGTFVAQRKTPETLAHTLLGLYEEVAARGGHVHSDVLRQEIVEADEEIGDALAVDPGEPVVLLERLRHVDGEPWSWTRTYLPVDLGRLILEEDLRDRSLYALLAEHGVRAVRGVRSAEAASADAEQGRLLEVGTGGALLVLRSVSYDSHDRIMEYFIAYHRGDRSRFEFQLTASPARENTTALRHVPAS